MRPVEELDELVGTSHESVQDLRVEAGKVAEFALAIGYDEPIFFDADCAREQGYSALPAPPTFTRVWQFPHNQPDGLTGYRGFDLGVGLETIHGEQEYEYDRPLLIGDVLRAETTLVDVSTPAASLTRAVLETEYTAAGEYVLTERTTLLAMTAGEMGEPTATSGDGSGDTLSRLDFIRYAGASGDFTPYHVDAEAARAAGYPSVFAQGMLTAGRAARALVDVFGLDALRTFRTRFVALVWPGDELSVAIDERSDDGRDVSVVVTDGDDRTVLTGSATIDQRS